MDTLVDDLSQRLARRIRTGAGWPRLGHWTELAERSERLQGHHQQIRAFRRSQPTAVVLVRLASSTSNLTLAGLNATEPKARASGLSRADRSEPHWRDHRDGLSAQAGVQNRPDHTDREIIRIEMPGQNNASQHCRVVLTLISDQVLLGAGRFASSYTEERKRGTCSATQERLSRVRIHRRHDLCQRDACACTYVVGPMPRS